MDHIWLVLHDVRHEDILAQVIWKVLGLLDLNAEENLLVEELLRILYQKIIVWFTVTTDITRPVRAAKLASHSSWNICCSSEDGWGSLAIERIT